MTPSNKITFIAPGIAVTGFMTPAKLRIVRTMGFASIINPLPQSGSVFEGMTEENLAHKARSFGMEYHKLTDQLPVSTLRDALNDVPKPAIIFSRTGRSALMLWALAMQDVIRTDEIAAAAARIGLTEIANPPSRVAQAA